MHHFVLFMLAALVTVALLGGCPPPEAGPTTPSGIAGSPPDASADR